MSNSEDLRKIAIDFFENVWNKGEQKFIDIYISEKSIGNDPRFGTGKESFRMQWRKWQEAFPNINFKVIETITEGDLVVTRWHLTGTNSGSYLSYPATGRSISIEGVSIDRIENGQIVSGFDAWDQLELFKQLKLKYDPNL